MKFTKFGFEHYVRFKSIRTGETMLEVTRLEVSGSTPRDDIRVELAGDGLILTGTISDAQGPVLRFHEDGREEHLADGEIEENVTGRARRGLIKGHG